MFFSKRLLTPFVLCAALSPFALAGCSQTASHGMSVSALTDAITPSVFSARPFRPTMRDRECLARAMFFESNRSSRAGMIAVGTVVMNRLKSGEHGNTICAVVGEPQQFAPGVLTRKMNSRALPDVMAAADAVLKGERSPKLRNTMFFHTAGLHFPYKNMHYTLVAGGNAFYEKRGRNFRELPPDSMFAFGGSTPATAPTPQVMVASADPVQKTLSPGTVAANVVTTRTKSVETADQQQLPADSPFMVASQEPPPPMEAGARGDKLQPAQERKKRMSSSTASYQVAYAEPAHDQLTAIVDPESAPVPTARAASSGTPDTARQPARTARRLKATVARPSKATVQMAADDGAELPSAARFGRDDSGDAEPVMSFNQ